MSLLRLYGDEDAAEHAVVEALRKRVSASMPPCFTYRERLPEADGILWNDLRGLW